MMELPNYGMMDYRGLPVYLKIAQGTLREKVMRGEISYIKIGSREQRRELRKGSLKMNPDGPSLSYSESGKARLTRRALISSRLSSSAGLSFGPPE